MSSLPRLTAERLAKLRQDAESLPGLDQGAWVSVPAGELLAILDLADAAYKHQARKDLDPIDTAERECTLFPDFLHALGMKYEHRLKVDVLIREWAAEGCPGRNALYQKMHRRMPPFSISTREIEQIVDLVARTMHV